MKCIACAKLNLRDWPKHAPHGLGSCEYINNLAEKETGCVFGTFTPFDVERNCIAYVKADDEITAKRIKWWNKETEKLNEDIGVGGNARPAHQGSEVA